MNQPTQKKHIMDAVTLKNQGNEKFAEKHYGEAIKMYNDALAMIPEGGEIDLRVSIMLNLSASFLFIEDFNKSVEYAQMSLELKPDNAKGYYRLGNAFYQSLQFKQAYDAYLKAFDLTKDAAIHKLAAKSKDAYTRLRLIEAMKKDEDQPLPDIEKPGDFPEVTLEFIQETAKKFREPSYSDVKSVFPEVWFGYLLQEVGKEIGELPNIVDINHKGEIALVGDTHGQFQDVCGIFDKHQWPTAERPFLFNGDFVDRGSQGVEILILLCLLRLYNPQCILLNRGNHESDYMNSIYGFKKECTAKYSEKSYVRCRNFFDLLPLAHILGNKIFVVHGGIFKEDHNLDDIRKYNRKSQPPRDGPVNDLLWSDPSETPGFNPNMRGTTHTFGPDKTEDFLNRHNFDLIVRSHQVQEEGYIEMHNNRCITLFSAPNYCGQMNNKGAILCINFDENGNYTKEFRKIEAEPVPPAFQPMKYCDLCYR